jgi:hypothetical protein
MGRLSPPERAVGWTSLAGRRWRVPKHVPFGPMRVAPPQIAVFDLAA